MAGPDGDLSFRMHLLYGVGEVLQSNAVSRPDIEYRVRWFGSGKGTNYAQSGIRIVYQVVESIGAHWKMSGLSCHGIFDHVAMVDKETMPSQLPRPDCRCET